ncbi:MAG: YbaN family protein [Anaerolineae bacterium]|nr:YbaN family protein [Anaerolineae bacterium]
MDNLIRFFWVAAGTLSVALAVLGMFLPVLPTTPFLLLAAFCYARGSERFHHWLLHNRWFGAYIRNYREGHGIPLREKVLTLAALWATIGFTVFYAVTPWWGRLILVAIATAVTVHLVRTKTLKPKAHAHPVKVSHSLGEPEDPAIG